MLVKHAVDNSGGKLHQRHIYSYSSSYCTCIIEDTFIYHFLHILDDIQMKIVASKWLRSFWWLRNLWGFLTKELVCTEKVRESQKSLKCLNPGRVEVRRGGELLRQRKQLGQQYSDKREHGTFQKKQRRLECPAREVGGPEMSPERYKGAGSGRAWRLG